MPLWTASLMSLIKDAIVEQVEVRDALVSCAQAYRTSKMMRHSQPAGRLQLWRGVRSGTWVWQCVTRLWVVTWKH